MDEINPSAGARLRALLLEKPLQMVGAINAYCAILAEKSGFHALYLSGAGVSNASYGIPDTGLLTLEQVVVDAQRIIAATHLPLLVDVDTGLGDVTKTTLTLEAIGAAGLQIEDQVDSKLCGHLQGKQLVSVDEMCARLELALGARQSKEFMIVARTDAIAVEGIDAAILRAKAYQAVGADVLFVEAALGLEDYAMFTQALDIPILANITEFGKTPLYTVSELSSVGVSIILYPLSAFRAMSLAALDVYQTIKNDGTQSAMVAKMQTRQELYDYLDYEAGKKSI